MYSANTSSYSEGAISLDYSLTIEGGRDYYLVAEVQIVTSDDNAYTRVIFPVAGPVSVPVYVDPGDEVPFDMSMEPAIITGIISTAAQSHSTIQGSETAGGGTVQVQGAVDQSTIESFKISTYIRYPQFDNLDNLFLQNETRSYDIFEPGIPGVNYTLLVAPEQEYSLQADITIDGVAYRPYESITAPAAGGTLAHNFTIDVTSAAISGTSILQGIDVYNASIRGNASSPSRSNDVSIPDISSGAYTLEAGVGTWYLRPYFSFYLPGNLSHLYGYLYLPNVEIPDITEGEHRTGIDFIVDPGFVTGTCNIWGANTNFSWGQVGAYSSPGSGYVYSNTDPDTEIGRAHV